jgi:Ca-activated chloride channel family protein
MLLLTDGEDNDSEPMEVAAQASKLGVKVFTVGIGSRSGELIPEFDEKGQITGYLKDSDGKYVTSRLDEVTLTKIAEKTGGEYFHADPKRFGVEEVESALSGLKRSENEARVVKQYDEVYEILLLPAFLLLVGEACSSDRRRRRAAAQSNGTQEVRS